jgi:hypothetical protein
MLGRGVAEALADRPAADVWSPDLRAVFGEPDIAMTASRAMGTDLRLEAGRLTLSLSDVDGGPDARGQL